MHYTERDSKVGVWQTQRPDFAAAAKGSIFEDKHDPFAAKGGTLGQPKSTFELCSVYINGRYVQPHEATLSVLDLGLLRGFAIFEYLRTYRGRSFHLDAHLERLGYSAGQLGLSLPCSLEEIEAIVLETKRRASLDEAGIKILITGGISEDQLTPSERTHLIVLVQPLTSYPRELFTQGISTVTTSLCRILPTSKTTHYIPGIVAMQKGKSVSAKEALYLGPKGEILEGATSNFFAFKGDTLYTCDSDKILFGITREVLLKLVQPHFRVELRPLKAKEIEEAFITSSSREVLPVTRIDGRDVGRGEVGPKTRYLMQLFHAYTQLEIWPPLSIPRHAFQEAKV